MNIPKRSSVIPFGYKVTEEDPKMLEEVPKELLALQTIKALVVEGSLSLREGSAWLEYKTDRKISHQGLKNLIYERLGS